MADVAFVGACAPELLDMGKQFVNNFSSLFVHQKRDEFVQQTIKHWQAARPDCNVMVLNNLYKHNVYYKDGIHMHVEIPKWPWGTLGYDIYVFKVNIQGVQ